MVEERVQRRLAAILAADVVGFSRLIRAHWAALVVIRGRQSVDRVGVAVELVVIPLCPFASHTLTILLADTQG